ncbi:MAG: PAS domain S-box protein [Candidatus Omnitrophica bacterium]|nr:PAS domain S-box protein [Candidatus Omnitrophota bacterium]
MTQLKNLSKENAELKARLAEAEELLAAIKSGSVDAFVTDDQKVFTLKGADHSYRVLVETINEGAATMTFDGTVMYCNSRLAEMLGVPAEKIIGRPIFDFVWPDEHPRLRSNLLQSKNKTTRSEILLKRNNATFIYALVSCNSLQLDNSGLCMVVTDLTEQKKTEIELEKHRSHLEALVAERTNALREATLKAERDRLILDSIIKQMPVGIIITDATGSVARNNEAMDKIWKREMLPNENTEKHGYVAYHKDGREYLPDEWPLSRSLQGGEDIVGEEMVILRGDGSKGVVHVSSSAIKDKNGKIIAGVVADVDITERKLAEDLLREDDARLRLAYLAAHAGAWEWDLRTNKNTWSEELWNVYGLAPHSCEPSYEAWFATIHPDDRAAVARSVQEAVRDKKELTAEWRLGNSVSGVRWLMSRGRPVLDDSGSLVRYIGIVMDITERKRAEESLRKSEERLQMALQVSKSFAFEWDPVSDRVMRSASCCSILGLAEEEARSDTSQNYFKRVHPEDRERFVKVVRSLDPDNSKYQTEYRVVLADGKVVTLEETAQASFDLDGKLINLMGTSTDITDRKRVEEAFKESELRYRRLFESAKDGIVILDFETGMIVDVNPFLAELLGYAHDELCKKHLWEIGLLRNVVPSREAFLNLQTSEFVRYEDLPLLTKGGETINVEFVSNVYLVDRKKVIQCNIRDITLRKHAEDILKRDKESLDKLVKERTRDLFEAQKALEQANRLSDIGTLAATVAHELRNPLAAVSLAANNIKRKAKNPDLDKHLENIKNKVVESDQIINNLLFYSRLKSPQLENVNILALIEECVDALAEQKRNKVVVTKELSSIEDVWIEADPVQAREVFNNVLNNALDAVLDKNGRIKIIAENEKDFIKVVVEDNGSGVSRDVIGKIFDPFFTTKAKGTGLGLSVCKQIVAMHNGQIWLQSEPGQGTSVIVRLPKRAIKQSRIHGL